ncbi:MAG: flagellar protein export ATPase FliI [Proteobacteria bacterium]|nr:flagellar protein export ATPase FliI [Pseudomonadota bacterium]
MQTDSLFSKFNELNTEHYFGIVLSLQGLSITVSLNFSFVRVGTRVKIYTEKAECIQGEVIGFSKNEAKVMVFNDLTQVTPGCKAYFCEEGSYLYPDASWCGRILNGLGDPSDDKGFLKKGPIPMAIQSSPPIAYKRAPVEERLDVGIRAINTFLTLCKGQRMGIFAGSGVGKSMLLSMLIRYAQCDVVVIGLIGERGRELYEFIHNAVGVDNLHKCVIVIATSDEPALMRRQAAYTTMTIAEYFRDQGLSVLCVMDSVTRFAMAQREIGLSCGEPPASKGYTPSVFSILPKLLERAGPGAVHEDMKTGYITGIFTVLVDGDDHNEPIADSVRSILDGHIVLDRAIANRHHYPAINILKSISRTVPACHFGKERDVVGKARQLLSTYDDMADMIRIGAYKKGSNKQVDEAILLMDALDGFTKQDFLESESLPIAFEKLSKITNIVL